MNKTIKLILLSVVLIIIINSLRLEQLFFVNAQERIIEQKCVDGFVRTVLNEYEGLSVHQLFYDTLMFKIDTHFTIKDMESVVLEFEEYFSNGNDADFIKRIKFLDQSVSDIMLPRRPGDCIIEFVKVNETDRFDYINIYSVNPEVFPDYCDFTSYGSLRRQYDFNICVPMDFDVEDNFAVINSVYFSGVDCEELLILNEHNICIIQEADNRGF